MSVEMNPVFIDVFVWGELDWLREEHKRRYLHALMLAGILELGKPPTRSDRRVIPHDTPPNRHG